MTPDQQEPQGSPEAPKPHKRRVRYSGRNPRRFEDKYKELNPEKYSEDVEHVIARGRTPAGMHIPICVKEILEILDPKPGETGLDATLGFGGHALEILPRLAPGGRLFALDVDPIELPRAEARLRGLGFSEEMFIARRMNFAGVMGLTREAGGGFDFILADLGVSSMQLDNPGRGFTYKFDGPLDLRLNPSRGVPASELLKSISVKALTALLADNADEPHAETIARSIKSSLAPITTTTQLSDTVRAALKKLPSKETDNAIKRSLQRAFMALRIGVNEELSVLDRFLEALPWCLKPGGRAAILSFHSGEDRRVKKAFAAGAAAGIYSGVAPTCLRPSPEEQKKNSRSSCAKLRWAVRSSAPAK
ncbi:MAG: 16S rRNA (cytosine(1402)-N(4))-methyltransferase RsmH [Elusimicrobiota bacterium]